MSKSEIGHKYLEHLEKGDIEEVIGLFNEDGIVVSPIYGTKKADIFYGELSNDTSNSKLRLKGIYEQADSNNIALYFSYRWTLKNNEVVEFDCVDIIELDHDNKIAKLTIIYDTIIARDLLRKQNQ